MKKNTVLKIETRHEDLYQYSEYVEKYPYAIKEKEILKLLVVRNGGMPSGNMKMIREISFLIKESVTIDKLIRLSKQIKQRFGIDCFQISIDRTHNEAHMLFNWIQEDGSPFILNNTSQKKLTVLIIDFLNLPRPKDVNLFTRDFLLESWAKDENIFKKQLDILANINHDGINYTVMKDALMYAEQVCKGLVK
ncbi:MAG: hypothetical protein E6507_09710 [Prevotella bivia]|nr:hypothetical protein [Prevotella bivia]